MIERERERDPLFPWKKKALHSVLQPLRYFFRRKGDHIGITLDACNFSFVIPKHLERATTLNLSMDIKIHIFLLSHNIYSSHSWPCISIIQYFIKNEEVTYWGTTSSRFPNYEECSHHIHLLQLHVFIRCDYKQHWY